MRTGDIVMVNEKDILKVDLSSFIRSNSTVFENAYQYMEMIKIAQMLVAEARQDGKVTFLTVYSNKVVERTSSLTKMLRYAQQKHNISEKTIQKAQDAYAAWVSKFLNPDRFTFELVSGKDIITGYREGPLSCMQGKVAQLQLYTVNPDKVQLLKVYDNGIYKGRALVWRCDDGRTLLDRVYPANGVLSKVTKHWAEEQGWVYTLTDGVNAAISTQNPVSITLKHNTNRRTPFLDTFKYLTDLNSESFTMATGVEFHKPRQGIGGFYEGLNGVMYSRYKDINGNAVPFTWDNDRVVRKTGLPSIQVKRGNALRCEQHWIPKDTDCTILNGRVIRTKIVTGTDGKLYLRTDTNKVRNKEEYVPKPDAVELVHFETTEYKEINSVVRAYNTKCT